MQKEGFVRVRIDGQVYEITDDIEIDRKKKHNIELVLNKIFKIKDNPYYHKLFIKNSKKALA